MADAPGYPVAHRPAAGAARPGVRGRLGQMTGSNAAVGAVVVGVPYRRPISSTYRDLSLPWISPSSCRRLTLKEVSKSFTEVHRHSLRILNIKINCVRHDICALCDTADASQRRIA